MVEQNIKQVKIKIKTEMKKILFCALAVIAALSTSCNKDVDTEGSAGVGEGKYTLPSVSATLESSDVETRTSLGTNQVVNWSALDRIAIINTKTNTISQYKVTSGMGTPVGHFEPVDAPAAYDDLTDLKAVYPAVAASVSGGVISFEINKDWPQEVRNQYGITSWDKDSPYEFSTNDIKVSYNTLTDPSNGEPVNFKFRQLGTWCTFTFDFTNSDYTRETMTSIEVTTVDGKKKISGKADIDFSDPAAPTLKEGSESSVKWTLNSTAVLDARVSKSLMLFPTIDNDQMKIVVKTNLHTFTFYATPKQPLTAGTVLNFPITVGKNFTEGELMADFTYTVDDAEGIVPFYYYGKTNCILLAGSSASGATLDVTPYQSSAFYERIDKEAPEAPMPTKAALIWKESTITAMDVNLSGTTLQVSGVTGNGNALVGIYDANSNLLWSYHVWCPKEDPTQGLLTYSVTNSGAYEVMPLFLGALDIAAPNNFDGIGLFYQWGRKDPLGRLGAYSGSHTVAVDVPGQSITNSDSFFLNTGDGENNTVALSDILASYQEDQDGDVVRYMINYATKNPTKYIIDKDDYYNSIWTVQTNNYLWGNPQGYNYPYASQMGYKAVFDPCPEGYRVAPEDLWLNFTTTKDNSSKLEEFNVKNLESHTTDHGYYFYYEGDKTSGGKADFYPATGYRSVSSGALFSIVSAIYCWSSAPNSGTSSGRSRMSYTSTSMYPMGSGDSGYGHVVRCVRDVR